MKLHKNARLTLARRLEMGRSVIDHGVAISSAATAHGVSVSTARKWIARYRTGGANALHDRSSRPSVLPTATAEAQRHRIVDLRRLGRSMQDIAREVGCSTSTVSRICARDDAEKQPVAKRARRRAFKP